MTLFINRCSNPACHDRYNPENYSEAVALIQFASGQLDYRIFSLCQKCKALMDDKMVTETIGDVIEYETRELETSIGATQDMINDWVSKYSGYKLVNWGLDRRDLDKKMLIGNV